MKMPVVIVYGIPEGTPGLEKLIEGIKHEVRSIKELEIDESQVSVFFPSDLVQTGLGEEIIIFVKGLFEKPERTPEVRQKLAVQIRDNVKGFAELYLIGICTVICTVEVFVESFNPDTNGFASEKLP